MNRPSIVWQVGYACALLVALDILSGTNINTLVAAITLYESAWLFDLLDDIGV